MDRHFATRQPASGCVETELFKVLLTRPAMTDLRIPTLRRLPELPNHAESGTTLNFANLLNVVTASLISTSSVMISKRRQLDVLPTALSVAETEWSMLANNVTTVIPRCTLPEPMTEIATTDPTLVVWIANHAGVVMELSIL